MEDEQKHIPNRLEKYRKMMGYTQRQVALMLGHKSTDRISKWENGTMIPSVINLIKLSVIYRTLMNDFYIDTFQTFRKELATRISLPELQEDDQNYFLY